jgi:hypothetical protein
VCWVQGFAVYSPSWSPQRPGHLAWHPPHLCNKRRQHNHQGTPHCWLAPGSFFCGTHNLSGNGTTNKNRLLFARALSFPLASLFSLSLSNHRHSSVLHFPSSPRTHRAVTVLRFVGAALLLLPRPREVPLCLCFGSPESSGAQRSSWFSTTSLLAPSGAPSSHALPLRCSCSVINHSTGLWHFIGPK